jgi:F-type H+-transporting ATPase subunit b
MKAYAATPTTTSTGAPSGAKGAFPPFATDTFASQLLWFAITFGLLYYLMSKVALPRVANVLEERRRKLAQDLEDAHRLKAQSEAAAEAHEKALTEARNRAKGIAQETRNQLTAESETKRKAVEAELGAKLAGAEVTIRARTAEAMGNVRSIAADTAAAIVERLIGRVPERSTVEAALDRTMRS